MEYNARMNPEDNNMEDAEYGSHEDFLRWCEEEDEASAMAYADDEDEYPEDGDWDGDHWREDNW
jgi:hypothetical protein